MDSAIQLLRRIASAALYALACWHIASAALYALACWHLPCFGCNAGSLVDVMGALCVCMGLCQSSAQLQAAFLDCILSAVSVLTGNMMTHRMSIDVYTKGRASWKLSCQ